MLPNRLTVLEINNRYREDGGENRAVDSTRALLQRHGHRVVVLSENSRRIETGHDRLSAALTALYSFSAKRKVRATCDRVMPDVVHVHNLYPLWSPSVLVAARDAGVPVVMSVHNYGLTCPIRTHFADQHSCHKCAEGGEHWCVVHNCRGDLLESAAYAARAWVARRGGWIRDCVSVFAAVSDTVAAYLRDAAGIPSARIAVVPNTVELPFTASDPAVGSYGLYVGRLSPEKGVRTLRAAVDMADESLHLHVIGSGPGEAAMRAGAPERITFHGWMSPNAVASMYRNARFTVVPSVCEETFSLTAAESMSHAVPVIASRIGGLREIVDDEVDGVLCEAGNAAALATQMSRLWREPRLCRRMGAAARQKIIDRYNEDRCYDHLLHAYGQALAFNTATKTNGGPACDAC
jgi:glycosyltransferase involved in cell wall biosynthesis